MWYFVDTNTIAVSTDVTWAVLCVWLIQWDTNWELGNLNFPAKMAPQGWSRHNSCSGLWKWVLTSLFCPHLYSPCLRHTQCLSPGWRCCKSLWYCISFCQTGLIQSLGLHLVLVWPYSLGSCWVYKLKVVIVSCYSYKLQLADALVSVPYCLSINSYILYQYVFFMFKHWQRIVEVREGSCVPTVLKSCTLYDH